MTTTKTRATPRGPEQASSRAEPRFAESWGPYLRRLVLGATYCVKPQRLAVLPQIWRQTLTYYLRPKCSRDELPALPRYYSERGFAGVSDDMSVPALIKNYARGLFPVCHLGPMKWWCPTVRAVQDPALAKVEKKVRRLIRQRRFQVTMDTDFIGVMKACAAPRDGKVPLTWITPRVMGAFYAAHKAGYAHSVEVWDQDGNLVGGLFGFAVGNVYFGESKFCHTRDASKVAVAYLERHLTEWGYKLYDAKWMSPHLAEMGFVPLPRDEYLSLLPWYTSEPGKVGRWQIEPRLDPTVCSEPPAGDRHAEPMLSRCVA